MTAHGGHSGAAAAGPGRTAHPRAESSPRSPHAAPHFFTATAPSPYAAPQTAVSSPSSPGTISFNFSAPSQLSPQVTAASLDTSSTVAHRATFVKGPAPASPQPAGGKTSGKGNGKGGITAKSSPKPTGNGGSTPASGRRGKGNSVRVRTVTAPLPAQGPARPERFFTIPFAPLAPAPAASGPLPVGPLDLAPAAKAGSQLYHFGASMLPRGWARESLREADQLKLPIALLIAMAVFVLGQSLVDRRDPKVSEAPERPNDDSLEFQ